MSDVILETARLALRPIVDDDAPFILRLLTDPSFLRFIGDRGVTDLDSAAAYIQSGPRRSYETHGFGLWLTERRDDRSPIGICGLLKRPTLDDVDLGYALLPDFWNQGYALEAVRGTLTYAKATLGLRRVVAIVSPENAASIALLRKAGFDFERSLRMSESAPEVQLFAIDLDARYS